MSKITEWCSHCENDVLIDNDKESTCPVCGARILPCAMCDMDKVNCTTDCPFENNKLAQKGGIGKWKKQKDNKKAESKTHIP